MEADRGGEKFFFVVVAGAPVLSRQLISAYVPARWDPRGTHVQFDWVVLQRLCTGTHTKTQPSSSFLEQRHGLLSRFLSAYMCRLRWKSLKALIFLYFLPRFVIRLEHKSVLADS